MRLTIGQREAAGVTVLALEGHLIFGAEADALRAHIQQLLKARRVRIVLDLQGIQRLDSVGVGTMMDAVRRAREVGGELHVARLSPKAAGVLDLLGLTRRPDIFRVFPDDESAVAEMKTLA